MRSRYGNAEAVAAEIGTQLRGRPADLRARKFGRVAKLLWPLKTSAALGAIAGQSERTAERWISGEFEPPGAVIAAVIVEMLRVE